MGIAIRYVFQDYNKIKKTEGFDELSIWQRMRFSFTFFSIFSSIISLIIFLLFFVFVKITIG
jgi:hypothetical protein